MLKPNPEEMISSISHSVAVKNHRLEHLFDAELQYRPEMAAVVSSEGRIGKLIGSGDGTLEGQRIQGTLRWTLFEKQGDNLCETNLAGVIKTNDGAQIQFDAKGYALRADKNHPNKWSLASALHFDTDDERYQWLNTALAVYEGEFDMNTVRHHSRVYIQRNQQ